MDHRQSVLVQGVELNDNGCNEHDEDEWNGSVEGCEDPVNCVAPS